MTRSTTAAWCVERGINRPGEVTAAVVDGYRRRPHRYVTAAGTPLGVRSQRQLLIALRVLFAWMAKQRLIEVIQPPTSNCPRLRSGCRGWC